MDKKGELTGEDISYIYPDMRMALKVKEKEERQLTSDCYIQRGFKII